MATSTQKDMLFSDVKFIFTINDCGECPGCLNGKMCRAYFGKKYMLADDAEIFLKALEEGDIKVVCDFIEKGLSPDVCYDDVHDIQVAHGAYCQGQTEIFNLFLEKGFDANFGNPNLGINPLIQAIIFMDYKTVKKLLDLGVTFRCGGNIDLEKFEELGSFLLRMEDKNTRNDIRQWLEMSGFTERIATIHPNWKNLLFGDNLLLHSIIEMDTENFEYLVNREVNLDYEEGYFLLKFLGKEKINQICEWLEENNFTEKLTNINPNWEELLFGEYE
jgi:hypothetical protein